LDFLGFSWIPSSESKFFNGLREFFREKKFLPLFPGVRSQERLVWPHCGRDWSWDKLRRASHNRGFWVLEAVCGG
jgi:hypothetical protein